MSVSGGNAVLQFAKERGITEVLHFTTNHGLVGIFHSGAVFSRDRLSEDKRLDSIRLLNCETRTKDAVWTDYVNLSISVVNKSMLGSSKKWHDQDGIWWAVLSFDVEILGHEGVYFTTTNNTYPVVRRNTGVEGLGDLFSDRIPWGYYGTVEYRSNSKPSHLTTEIQAEVLYPLAVPLTMLRAIYVPEPNHIDEIAGLIAAMSAPPVNVICRPEIFK